MYFAQINLFLTTMSENRICQVNFIFTESKKFIIYSRIIRNHIHTAKFFQVLTGSNFEEILIKVQHPEQQQQPQQQQILS